VEDSRREIEHLQGRSSPSIREKRSGVAHDERLAILNARLTTVQTQLKELEDDWSKSGKLVNQVRDLQNGVGEAGSRRQGCP